MISKKKYFLIFLSFFILFKIGEIFSQQVHEEWVARSPGPSNDVFGPFLSVDKNGNSYLVGTHVTDSVYLLCVKYDTYGVQQWEKTYIYPGEAYIRPSGLALDSSGNVYVIADQGPAFDLPTHGLIAKFNSINGNIVWVKRYFGDYSWGAFRDIKIDRLNNVYVAGWSDTSHLVINYNTNGDSVWVRKFHPTSYREVARACTIDDSLNIIFTGQRIFYYYSAEYDSLLTVKYSPTGVLRWERSYGYDFASNVGTKITADQNGNLYVGGGTTVSGDAVYLTLKYDRNGTQQWAKIYQGSGNGISYLRDITLDKINNALFVTGGAVVNGISKSVTLRYNIFNGDSIWVKTNSGPNNGGGTNGIINDSIGNTYITGTTYNYPTYNPLDIMTLKFSFQGNPQWLITYNNSNYGGWDSGLYIELNNNNIYVLGTSQSAFQLSDYVVIKYSQLNGTKKISNQLPYKFNLSSYPNPFNPQTSINFSILYKSHVNIILYDILGREVQEIIDEKDIKPGEYKINWDASSFSSGVYFCRINAVYKIENNIQNYLNTIKLVLLR